VFDSLPLVIEPVLDRQILTEEESFRNAMPDSDHRGDFRRALRAAKTAASAAARRTATDGSPLHVFSGPETEDRKPQTIDRHPSPVSRRSAVRVGVVGHAYLLFDSGLSLGVLDKVRDAGAEPVVLFPTDAEVTRESRQETALNWYYELELLAAARQLLEKERVDGLLLVASFACGTGAVTNDLIQRSAVHRYGVPTILVLLDEHTGEAGLVTRVESFVDVLRLRKR